MSHVLSLLDPPQTALEPGANRLLGDLLLDQVLELFALQQLFELEAFADVHAPIREHAETFPLSASSLEGIMQPSLEHVVEGHVLAIVQPLHLVTHVLEE